jgi:hypothetical protein
MHVDGENIRVALAPHLIDGLDYWEVDPDWDGQVFRSYAQAGRPRRNGEIAAELLVPDRWVGERVAVRIVGITGHEELILLSRYPQ